jgi:multimeric flavodoxin WrbA
MTPEIAIICGSPRRNGNTNRIVNHVIEAAEKAGAAVTRIDAARLEYKSNGCRACMACQRTDTGTCVIDDEAGALIGQLPEKDIIIFATPVYWFGPTAQLKLFMDRMFSLLRETPDGPQPKFPAEWRIGLIATGGGGMEDGLDLLDQTIQKCAAAFQTPCEKLLVPYAPQNPEAMENREDLPEKVAAFVNALLADRI